MKFSILHVPLLILIACSPLSAQRLIKGALKDSIRVETAICESDKYIWIGTNKGLIQFNKKTGKEYLLTHEKTVLPSNLVTCIVCLADGQTYIGTSNGILWWDNYAFMVVNSENSDLPDNYIEDIFLNQAGELWVKTKNCCFLQGIGKHCKTFKLQKSVFEKLNLLHETPDSITR